MINCGDVTTSRSGVISCLVFFLFEAIESASTSACGSQQISMASVQISHNYIVCIAIFWGQKQNATFNFERR